LYQDRNCYNTSENSLPNIDLTITRKEVKYNIRFKPRAVKDIRMFPSSIQLRIIKRIEEMGDNLKGNVKHLTDTTPEFRLRVGDYRVLFEVEGETVVIYRILHRREAYR
jgi:mRNA interferase RelE/StbE